MRRRHLLTPEGLIDAVTRLYDGAWGRGAIAPVRATRCTRPATQCRRMDDDGRNRLDYVWHSAGRTMCRAPATFVPEGVQPVMREVEGMTVPVCPYRRSDAAVLGRHGKPRRKTYGKTRPPSVDSPLMRELRGLVDEAARHGPPVVAAVALYLSERLDERAYSDAIAAHGFTRDGALLEFARWMIPKVRK